MYTKDEVKAAMLILVTDLNADPLHSLLRKAVQVSGQLPIKLTGDAAPMNPLLWLSLNDRNAFNTHMEIIDTLRVKRGLAPLVAAGFDKNDYQAGFMAQGRLRRGRAVNNENAQRPPRDKLRGQPRLEFERVTQAQWKKQIDAQLAVARKANGGTLPRDLYKSIITRFWAAVDVALDEKEEQTRRNK